MTDTDMPTFRAVEPLRRDGVNAKVSRTRRVVVLTDGPECEPLNLTVEEIRWLISWLQAALPLDDAKSPPKDSARTKS